MDVFFHGIMVKQKIKEMSMIQLPQTFLDQMKDLLNNEYEQYLQSFESPRYHGLRVNTNKISVKDFLKIAPFHLEPIPWTSNGFYYDPTIDSVTKHPYFDAGLYYIQEPSAMLPAATLPIKENDFVLDTCAAPGGKSSELANKLNNTGLLVSNDISSSRCQALLKNMERAGCTNLWLTSMDTQNLEAMFDQTFDALLVDAPCSGEGMFRKEPDLIKSWIEKDDTYYPPIQKQIIDDAYHMLKPGGYLLYSTCTFSIKENEEVIRSLLNKYDDIKPVKIDKLPGFMPGIDLPEAVRLYPHKIKGEGHFVCLLQKEKTTETKTTAIKPKSQKVSDETFKFLSNISIDFSKGVFEIKNEKVLWQKTMISHPKKLRALRTGLFLGQEKNKRFEPSQALAFALNKESFKQVIDLNSDDIRVTKYLKGETIDVKDIDSKSKGWVLICVDGHGLGFGKLQNGQCKNKLGKGWIKP